MEEFAILAAVAVLVIVTVSHYAPRLGVATPVLLALIGIAASFLPGSHALHVDPHLILVLVLPPILYSAAITVPAADFRRNFKAISALAVVLVLVSAVVTGLLLNWLLPDIGLAAAIALGAVVSPTDAVAATAIGKRLGLPPRMVTVLEGEGLVNDATALVMLRSAIAATAGTVSMWGAVSDFIASVAVGAAIGALVGAVSVRVRSKLDEPVLTTALSLTVPFLAFVPTEELHGSGVLAVVVAGLITGHQSSQHFSAQDRVSERINWRTIQLLLENGVFLLMGYQLQVVVSDVAAGPGPTVAESVTIGLLITAVLVALRMLFILPLVAWLRSDQRKAAERAPYLQQAVTKLSEIDGEVWTHLPHVRVAHRYLRTKVADGLALSRDSFGWNGGIAIGWSGMRGVVTLAAAQSLPESVTYRSQLILIALTVSLVTLIGHGMTLPWVIRRLGIRGTDAEAEQRELSSLVEEIAAVMEDTLENPDLHRTCGERFSDEVLEQVHGFNAQLARRLSSVVPEDHDHEIERRELGRVLLEAGQSGLLDARASGTYSADSISRLQAVLDAEVIRLDVTAPR